MINPISYKDTSDLKKVISLVPFGLSEQDITNTDLKIVEQKIPNLKPDDKVIYWGGGIFNWFDPLSIVKAIEQISKTRKDIKLFFLGVKHPNPKIKQMEMANKTIEYCKKHDLLGKFVFFNFGWTPYGERRHFLARADMGISTHYDNLETRLSFRTRILDYLWADLPMILTEGDSMADLCQAKNLGRVVKYQDVSGIKKAIVDLADHKKDVEIIQKNIVEAKKDFYWQNCLKDLISLIKKDGLLNREIPTIKFWHLSFNFYLAGFKKKFFK
jgi:glycosyltransferase involved in cell wall biosynthesis